MPEAIRRTRIISPRLFSSFLTESWACSAETDQFVCNTGNCIINAVGLHRHVRYTLKQYESHEIKRNESLHFALKIFFLH